jgi:hypothetical protein
MSKEVKFGGASAAGFHFVNLYQCCQRKFFMKWFVRPVEKFLSPALIFGSAFHEGKATFYQTKSLDKAKAKVRSELKKYRSLFEYQEQYDKAVLRCPVLLQRWAEIFGYADFDKYDLVEVEGNYNTEVPGTNGFIFTGRIDALVRDKADGQLYILETKTAGSSVNLTINGVFNGDQATSYIWLAGLKYGEKIAGVIADVAYWNTNAKYESNIEIVRSELITRSDDDIEMFVKGLALLFSEISQKAEAFNQGYDAASLFPRNTFYCMSYGKACEFINICRLNYKKDGYVPLGFTKDKRKLDLGGYIEDRICES